MPKIFAFLLSFLLQGLLCADSRSLLHNSLVVTIHRWYG